MTPSGVTVVIPSYRRPDQLARCLAGIAAQTLYPEELIVVVRQGDRETEDLLATWPGGLTVVSVDSPGQVAALQAGAERVSTDIVAFTDDDAVPRRDWLAGLARHFRDPSVGAVGGRDVVHGDVLSQSIEAGTASGQFRVGLISTWGRLSGNHHVGVGPARDVDTLKGVNMAVRSRVLAFPKGLRGAGAQVHNEVSVCLWVRLQGCRVIYDPSVVVDHFPAPRHDSDTRDGAAPEATANAAFNLTASVLALAPRLAARRMVYGVLVGDAGVPGLGRGAISLFRRKDRLILNRLIPSLRGQLLAYRECSAGKGIKMYPVGRGSCAVEGTEF